MKDNPGNHLDKMLKSKKWGEVTEGFLRWILDTHQDEDDDLLEMEVKIVERELPEITNLLHARSLSWLLFFRELQGACGTLKLGRRTFPTRFIWSKSPLEVARNALLFPLHENPDPFERLPMLDSSKAAEASYSFPLRRNINVQLRLPDDISAEELSRLADFIRLLPHS